LFLEKFLALEVKVEVRNVLLIEDETSLEGELLARVTSELTSNFGRLIDGFSFLSGR
jgi:hypothetical protein